ncbi:hypothetical protein L596_011502 [Steinernema carpocapsae]|uniref:Uncharacterized protein n=1 Tax=Steinernema carpocapsae TaxID=34508 RepID=A0A4V6A4H8_STECR|nr:hypothetical protein L596_011502 [Steinernema carpocapsae]
MNNLKTCKNDVFGEKENHCQTNVFDKQQLRCIQTCIGNMKTKQIQNSRSVFQGHLLSLLTRSNQNPYL